MREKNSERGGKHSKVSAPDMLSSFKELLALVWCAAPKRIICMPSAKPKGGIQLGWCSSALFAGEAKYRKEYPEETEQRIIVASNVYSTTCR